MCEEVTQSTSRWQTRKYRESRRKQESKAAQNHSKSQTGDADRESSRVRKQE